MSYEPRLPSRIRYEYIQNPQNQPQLTHGVWGGINTQGEIVMNLYVENDKLPAYSEHIVEADGSLGHELSPTDDAVRTITRKVHSSVVVNYYTARELLEWLEDKITALEMEDGSMRLDGKKGVEQ